MPLRNTHKAQALAEFLNAESIEIEGYENNYALFDQEFLVLTETEANEMLIDLFPEHVLSVDTSLILRFCVPGVSVETVTALTQAQHGALGMLYLIRDIDALRNEAIELHGRGFFLADDGEEHEVKNYLIYTVN